MKLLRLQAVYAKKRGAVEGDDVDITTHDFVIDDATWPDAGTGGLTHNYASMEASFQAFWDALQAVGEMSAACGLKEYRWYREDDGELPWGDPARVQSRAGGPDWGTGVTGLPPQCSSTVTELTDWRRHWGRFYIPGLATNYLATDGSLGSQAVTGFADAAEALYNSWNSKGVTCVVLGSVKQDINVGVVFPNAIAGNLFERWIGKDLTDTRRRVAFPVTGIRVDDVIDVQRRRRFEAPLIRATRTLA